MANTAVKVALISAAAVIVGGLITMVSPPVQDAMKSWFAPKPAPPKPTPPRKTKDSLCNDPRTGQPYKFDIPNFYPEQYTHLNEPYGGDAANPGHKFYLPKPVEAPGIVLSASCRHEGTHEEITYCGPLRSALGQPTKFAEIEGWINGQGGPTYMTVYYQMPCQVLDDTP